MKRGKKKKNKSRNLKALVRSKDFPLEIKAAISGQRSRKALGLLNEARKSGVDIDTKTEEDVYLLRFDDLHSQGHINEALQFYEQNIRTLPFCAKNADSPIQYMINLKLGLTEGWDQYEKDTEKTSLMDQLVLADLMDPRLFCENSALTADHPLKFQAGEILKAWEFIDAGKYSQAATCLGIIGRRSPFRAWRLFLQALTAYYQEDKAAFDANLSRLPVNAAVVPLADRLRNLEQGQIDTEIAETPVGRHLARGDDRSELLVVDQLIDRILLKDARVKVDGILERIMRNGQYLLSCEIVSNLAGRNIKPSSSVFSQPGDLVTLRLAFHQHDIKKQRWELEEAFAKIRKKNPGPLLDKLDHSILLTKIAEIWFSIFKLGGGEFEDCGCDDIWQPRKIRDLQKACPGCVVSLAYNICQQALDYFPLEKTYRVAADILESAPELDGGLPLLDSWIRDFPDSMEALERSSRLFIHLEKWDEAENALALLGNHSGQSPALNDLKFDLAISRAISLCANGTNVSHDVSTLFEPVLVSAGWKHVLVETIKWLSCGKERKLKQEQGKVLASLNAPYKIFQFSSKIKPGFKKHQLPKTVQKQLETEAEAFVFDLDTLITLPVLEWSCDDNFDELIDIAELSGLLDKLGEDPDLSYRFLLLHLKLRGVRISLPKCAYKITAGYLSEKEEHVADFWALRALYYCYEFLENSFSHPLPEIVYECLTVAFHYGVTTPVIMDKLLELGVETERVEQGVPALTPKKIREITKRESGRVTDRSRDKVIYKWHETCIDDEFDFFDPMKVACPPLTTVDEFKQLCEKLEIPVNIEITEAVLMNARRSLKTFFELGPEDLEPGAIVELTMAMMTGASSIETILKIVISDFLQKVGNKGLSGKRKRGKQFSLPF